jgi:hypothetical protein
MQTPLPKVERPDIPEAAQARDSAGDPIPSNCQLIEVHVAELNQLFNAIDPAPFARGIWIPTLRNSSWVGPARFRPTRH